MKRADLNRYRLPASGPLAFIGEQCVLADGRPAGATWERDPWINRDLLGPVFERDRDRPLYPLVYLELPRGHWKSGGGAAIAIAEAILSPSTDVVVAAADRDQAGVIGENVRGYLARNRDLDASFKATRDTFEIPARGSRIRIISSDAPTAWGLGGTHRRFRVIADELSVWPKSDLWEALVSATGKVADAQTIVLSNAGFDPATSWQWKVRETAEREGWGYLYSAEGPIASWISKEWIERMRGLLPAIAFARVIENTWSAMVGDFVSAEQWQRCVDLDWSRQGQGEDGQRYVAAVDLGLVRDRTALVIAHRDPEGNVRLDDLRTWQGSHEQPVEISEVESALVDAAERFSPLKVVVDPWQLAGSVQRLDRAGVEISEFKFSAPSVAKLSANLYSLIAGSRLRAFPDRELEQEILGLRVVQRDAGWRIDHKAGGFSDRVMALGMAALVLGADRGRQVPEGVLAEVAAINARLVSPSAWGRTPNFL